MALGRGKGQLGIPVDSFPTTLRAALCSQYTLEPSMNGWSRPMPMSYQEFSQFFDQALEERGIKRFQKAYDELRRDVENLRSAVRQLIPSAQPCRPWDIAREEREMNEDRSFGSMIMGGSWEHSDHCVRCNPDLLKPLLRSTQENSEERIRQQRLHEETSRKWKQEKEEYEAMCKERVQESLREMTAWRDRLNAQRDPVKAATPINVDEG